MISPKTRDDENFQKVCTSSQGFPGRSHPNHPSPTGRRRVGLAALLDYESDNEFGPDFDRIQDKQTQNSKIAYRPE